MVLSPTARELYGALWTFIVPRLASDEAPPQLSKILSGVTARNLSDQIPALTRKIKAQTRGRLALDADLDDLTDFLGNFEEEHAVDQEEKLDAAQAAEQFRQLLRRLDPKESERFIELLRDEGVLEPDGEPGGTMNPYREAEDRRSRRARDQGPPAFPGRPRTGASERYGMDAASGFNRRFPSASRITIS